MAASNRKTPVPPTRRVALVYTRVSTGQQATEGVSLDAQESQCRALAEQKGLELDGVFMEEGVSGSLAPHERAAFSALLTRKKYLEGQGAEVVVVAYDFSRVSRSVTDLLELVDEKRGGVLLATVKENFDVSTPTGRLLRGVLAQINEFNREMTGERTKDALAYVKSKGTQLGQRRVEQIVKPEVVQTIAFALKNDKLSLRRTVERLNDLGLPTPRGLGGRWSLATLQRVVEAMKEGKFDLETGIPIAPESQGSSQSPMST